jgi:hypothetical protein
VNVEGPADRIFIDRLAMALLARVAALFGLGTVHQSTIEEPVFQDGGYAIGGRTLDSLDIAVLVVTLEEDLGGSFADAEDLLAARTLRALASTAAGRCNAGALEKFCTTWAPVGH